MPNDEISPGTKTGADQLAKAATDDTGFARALASQQVSWWSVHEHVLPLLNSVDSWPMVGTPEWCELPDGDVRKGRRRLRCRAALGTAGRDEPGGALPGVTGHRSSIRLEADCPVSFVRDCSVEYGAYIPRLTSRVPTRSSSDGASLRAKSTRLKSEKAARQQNSTQMAICRRLRHHPTTQRRMGPVRPVRPVQM
jgi:hypothetical protein